MCHITEIKKMQSQEQVDTSHMQSVESTEGRVRKQIVRHGVGEQEPQEGSQVFVHYVGVLKNTGKQFDSSRQRENPFHFTLGDGSVIKGWDIAVRTMKRAEIALFEISSDLAYGEQGTGTIPPNSTLIFEIELLGWKLPDISSEKDGSLIKRLMNKGEGWDTPSIGTNCMITYSAFVRERNFSPDLSDSDQRTVLAENQSISVVVGDEQVPKELEQCIRDLHKRGKAQFFIFSKHDVKQEELQFLCLTDKEKEYWSTATRWCLDYEIEMIEYEKEEREWNMTPDQRIHFAILAKEQGNALFKQNRLQVAKKRYKRVINLLSLESEMTEQHLEAKNQLEITVYNNLAIVESKNHRYKKVIEYSTKALENDPSNVKALYKRGQAYYMQEIPDDDAAKADLLKALSLEPNNNAVKMELARVNKRLQEAAQQEKQMYSRLFS